MANPVKGEVAFNVADEQFKFVLGTYALAAIERRSGMSSEKFFSREEEEWRLEDVLIIFHAGLLRHHDLSEKDAADLLDSLSIGRGTEIIRQAITLSMPARANGSNPTRPRKAVRASTG